MKLSSSRAQPTLTIEHIVIANCSLVKKSFTVVYLLVVENTRCSNEEKAPTQAPAPAMLLVK